MRVSELMNAEVVSVRHDDRLSVALQSMLWAGVRHLPVLRDGLVVGVLSERDLMRHRARVGDWTALEHAAEEAMSTPAEVVRPDDDVAHAAGRMAAQKIGCLPVVDGDRLVGMITTTDILAHQARQAFGPLDVSVGPTVAEVMSREPVTVTRNDYLIDAAERMSLLGVRHLPVVDSEGRVEGILSDRDVRLAIGGGSWQAGLEDESTDFQQLRVADAMTTEPLTLSPEVPLLTAVSYFIDWRIGAIPVVDRDDHAVGIISYVDALRALRTGQRAAALHHAPRDDETS